jgi:hypothetical protein
MGYMDLVLKARKIAQHAEREGRQMTAEEYQEAEHLLDRATDAKSIEEQLERIDPGRSHEVTMMDPKAGFPGGNGPGDAFVASGEYKSLSRGARPQKWTTGAVEVSSASAQGLQMKAGTLYESGQGAGLIPTPQVVPGVISKLFEPLGVATTQIYVDYSPSEKEAEYVDRAFAGSNLGSNFSKTKLN